MKRNLFEEFPKTNRHNPQNHHQTSYWLIMVLGSKGFITRRHACLKHSLRLPLFYGNDLVWRFLFSPGLVPPRNSKIHWFPKAVLQAHLIKNAWIEVTKKNPWMVWTCMTPGVSGSWKNSHFLRGQDIRILRACSFTMGTIGKLCFFF